MPPVPDVSPSAQMGGIALIHIKTAAVEPGAIAAYHGKMFTIEHEFDATVITLIDEGAVPLAEDVIVEAYEDCVVLEQLDPETRKNLFFLIDIVI